MRARVWRMRRPLAALALAAAVVAGIVGFAHSVHPGPGYTGGERPSAAVQGFPHVQESGPTYTGG